MSGGGLVRYSNDGRRLCIRRECPDLAQDEGHWTCQYHTVEWEHEWVNERPTTADMSAVIRTTLAATATPAAGQTPGGGDR